MAYPWEAITWGGEPAEAWPTLPCRTTPAGEDVQGRFAFVRVVAAHPVRNDHRPPREEWLAARVKAHLLWLPMLTLLLASAISASSAAGVAASRNCGSFQVRETHPIVTIRFHVTVEKGRVTCVEARKVLRAFLSGKGMRHGGSDAAHTYWTVYGWSCGTGTGGGACTRGERNAGTAHDYILAQVSRVSR